MLRYVLFLLATPFVSLLYWLACIELFVKKNSTCFQVMKVKVVASGHQRSLFGIIVMEEVTKALAAMSSLNGHRINERPISVTFVSI